MKVNPSVFLVWTGYGESETQILQAIFAEEKDARKFKKGLRHFSKPYLIEEHIVC